MWVLKRFLITVVPIFIRVLGNRFPVKGRVFSEEFILPLILFFHHFRNWRNKAVLILRKKLMFYFRLNRRLVSSGSFLQSRIRSTSKKERAWTYSENWVFHLGKLLRHRLNLHIVLFPWPASRNCRSWCTLVFVHI